MATLTYPELKSMISSVVTASNLSNDTFTATHNNVASLVDKIGRIFSIDTNFKQDKLARFDSDFLLYGRTLEEFQADLILPSAYDSTGANVMSPDASTFRPNFYSYTIGRKKIKQTIYNDNLERAVHNAEEFANIVAILISRLDDSAVQYRYGLKREMVGRFIELAEAEQGATSVFATSTAYAVGTCLKKSASDTERGIVFKAIANTNTDNWATLVSNGYIVELDLVTDIAKPVDSTTGEAFIEQVKKDIEVAGDISQGHSLNGNALGASAGLVLIVKQGIVPNLDVNTYAGAFHDEKLALPAEIVVIPDFGANASSDYYAVLMDARAMRLHPSYDATRENLNGDGDFINYVRHLEFTAHISRNVFFKAYKTV